MNVEPRSRRICIVEDDEPIRDSVRMLLESYQFSVTDFANPIAMLSVQDLPDYDCLIVDLHLPIMSGLELLEILRSRRVPTPAILLSGDASAAHDDRVRRIGALTVLQKPVPIEILLDRIEHAVRHGL
jgi:FixJ family two-component response regulator